MILDPRPKTRREELYGREDELITVIDIVIGQKMPVTMISGVRRIGKTSLIRVAENELRDDDRFLLLYLQGCELARRGQLGEELARKLGVEPCPDPVDVLKKARSLGRHIVVVLDEIQEAPRRTHYDIMSLAEAIVYKIHYSSLILLSSAPGLAKETVGIGKRGSALYRYSSSYEIWLEPLKPGDAEALLRDGLREQGLNPDPSIVHEAVEFFGAIPGWLVFFGLRLLAGLRPEQIYQEAIRIALEEIKKLAPRPQLLLKVLAEGNDSWTRALKALEDLEGRWVSRNGFAKALHYLEKRALVRDYKILDPVYERAAKLLDPSEPLARLGLLSKQSEKPRREWSLGAPSLQ